MNKEITEKWVAIDGSIFTEKEYKKTHDWGTKSVQRTAIAFNVGQEIAEYIVRIHNAHQHPVHSVAPEYSLFLAAKID